MNDTDVIKSFSQWYNILTTETKSMICEALNRDSLFLLDDNYVKELIKIRDFIIKLIRDDLKKDEIIKKIILTGIDEKMAIVIYDYCNNVIPIITDISIIKKISEKDFKKIVDFIIEKYFLYHEYQLYSFQYFVELGNFEDRDKAEKAFRFLYFQVLNIINRNLSPDTLLIKLKKELDLSEEKAAYLISSIKQNILDLHQAYLLSQIKELLLSNEDEEN